MISKYANSIDIYVTLLTTGGAVSAITYVSFSPLHKLSSSVHVSVACGLLKFSSTFKRDYYSLALCLLTLNHFFFVLASVCT